MALTFVEPLPPVLRSYQRGMAEILGSPLSSEGVVHVPVVTYPMAAIVAGATPEDESPSGCRFYAAHPPPLGVLSSEMTNPSDYGKADFRAMLDGQRAEWGWERIAQLRALPEVTAAEYALHLISIPSLFLEAFLLRSTDGNAPDLVVATDLFADTLAPPVTEELGQFLKALQPFAIARRTATGDPLLP